MLEVCVDSIQSAKEAAEGGASRIELCSALSEGGLTPTVGLLRVLKYDLKLKIPIFCMLRPRRGSDFIYTEEEMSVLLYDMDILKSWGSDGFVFGSLTPERHINVEQSMQVIDRATGLPCTFHRAFDLTIKEKMYENCKILSSLGYKRILTSGFEETAEKGLNTLKNLISNQKEIIIMPGSGISRSNLVKILESGCYEYHASARKKKSYLDHNRGQPVSMGAGSRDAESYIGTCRSVVDELCFIARNFQHQLN